MKKLIPMLALLLSFVQFSHAQSDQEAYKKSLKKMFELNGSAASYKVAIRQTLQMFKGQFPSDDDKFIEKLEAELLETSLDDLFELLLPIYAKYLTQEDVDGLIRFYETPTGKKFAEKTPLIMQESMQVGQAWGMKLAEKITKKIQEGND